MQEGKDGCLSGCCVCLQMCVHAEQTALAGFLLGSPGPEMHESAASRIYSQLIKLAFVLLLGQQPVSTNIEAKHTQAPRRGRNKHTPVRRLL